MHHNGVRTIDGAAAQLLCRAPGGHYCSRHTRATEIRVFTDAVIGLLVVFGRDVAGSIQFFVLDGPGEPNTPVCGTDAVA